MAFSAKWITAAGTVNLSDGNPYKLESGLGLGGAEVRNLYERGPQQDGVSDLGYRIDPRTATLGINFAGTSAAHLDSLRSTLQYHFSPRQGLGTLQITRDDGEVREIYARRAGPLDMPLVVAHRPGNLHRTVVQLFAPNPAWTEPAAGTVAFLAPSDWWLAFNTIGSANVLEHVESPGTAQAWTYLGTVNPGTPWFVAFRSGLEGTAAADSKYAFQTGDGQGDFTIAPNGSYAVSSKGLSGTAMMTAGTHNYFVLDAVTENRFYRDGVLIASGGFGAGLGMQGYETGFATAHWRSNFQRDVNSVWSNALPRAAVYDILPTAAQIAALNTAMESGGSVYNVSMAYAGDLPEYPVIKITGPISDAVLTNTTTGEKLDFTGYTIGSADFYTIDLRYGSKTVRNSGGDNKIGQLSSDSDLAAFHIEPAPNAAGGTNIFSLAGTATGTATAALITYYNRFEGW